jgi:hypothetical protein
VINLSSKITQAPPSADKIYKNIQFGTAMGLTQTAKDGQSAVRSALKGTFTLRNSWSEPSNKFGIKIKPATKDDLSAEVRTMADWLNIHEEGGIKHAQSGRLAIPTDNVRRNKRLIIPRNQRPKGLARKAFVLMTKKGPVLAQRISRGKRKGLIVLYGLETSARIKKQSTFYDPIKKVVAARLNINIEAGIQKALDTMR